MNKQSLIGMFYVVTDVSSLANLRHSSNINEIKNLKTTSAYCVM